MGKTRIKRILILAFGGIIICIFCAIIGLRPFADVQSEKLCYVFRVSLHEPKLIMLNDEEITELAALLRQVRVRPSLGTVEKLDGGAHEYFVFEYTSQKGKMMRVQVGAYDITMRNVKPAPWIAINNQVYRISNSCYEAFLRYGEAIVSQESS